MKLFIILLCLLSERYLPHALSFHRFNWFQAYYFSLCGLNNTKNPILQIILVVLPIILVVWALLFLFANVFFGIVAFLINILLLYYCLGPQNPFYPLREIEDPNTSARHYLVDVNSQLFAVLFWFVLFGPIALITYRLLTLLQKEEITGKDSNKIVTLLDWVTVRVTLLLYLLAGNFNKGIHFFREQFLSKPDKNSDFLGQGGLLSAIVQDDTEIITLTAAQELVERALIIFLVFIAIFTLAACM